MSDKLLLPCPFCGGEAHFAVSSDGYAVECDGELCVRNAMQEHPSEEYAALWWNTRSITAAAVYGYQAEQGTCRIELPGADYQCNGCGEIVGSADPTSELYIDGNAIEMWNYCPSCGRKVAK